jgi:hypothetical protein
LLFAEPGSRAPAFYLAAATLKAHRAADARTRDGVVMKGRRLNARLQTTTCEPGLRIRAWQVEPGT